MDIHTFLYLNMIFLYVWSFIIGFFLFLGIPINDDQIVQTEIEEFADDDDEDIVARGLDHLAESGSSSGDESFEVDDAPPPIPTTSRSRGSTRGISGMMASARGRGQADEDETVDCFVKNIIPNV